MKTDLYYFTGTGNSLWIARELQQRFDNAELHSIPAIMRDQSPISGETIGIVCPIYMHTMPHIVADFITTISRADYLFLVFAGGGELGRGRTHARKLITSQGLTLSSMFNIPMPSNYTPFGYPSEESISRRFASAEQAIGQIADTVSHRAAFIDDTNTSLFRTHVFPGLIYQMGYPRIPGFDSQFATDGNCNGCGVCEQVCPVGNITMRDGAPVWNHRCQQCYACLQWCPTGAIQAGKRTIGVERYHHPAISVKDVIAGAGEA